MWFYYSSTLVNQPLSSPQNEDGNTTHLKRSWGGFKEITHREPQQHTREVVFYCIDSTFFPSNLSFSFPPPHIKLGYLQNTTKREATQLDTLNFLFPDSLRKGVLPFLFSPPYARI